MEQTGPCQASGIRASHCKRRGGEHEPLFPWTSPGSLSRGHTVQHRIPYHRLPPGHRFRPLHRPAEHGALPAVGSPGAHRTARFVESCRHRAELLGNSGFGHGCLLCGTSHTRCHHRPQSDGQDYRPQPRRHPAVPLRMGQPARHSGHDYRPAAHHPNFGLLQPISALQRTGTTATAHSTRTIITPPPKEATPVEKARFCPPITPRTDALILFFTPYLSNSQEKVWSIHTKTVSLHPLNGKQQV